MLQLLTQQASQILTAVMLMVVLSLILRSLALKVPLVDTPSARKKHQNITPLIGGICIFLACCLSIFIFDYKDDQDLRSLFVCASLFLFLGVLDDQFDVQAKVKLIVQIMISFIFLASTGLQITNLGIPFGLAHPVVLGSLSLPFSIFAIVGLTNAFNMIDGCDGLAASLAALAFLAMLYFGSSQFEYSTQIVLLTLSASIFVFLFFNFSNNLAFKVFLGDGGSLFLGFTVSVLLIELAEGNENYSPSIVLWFVAVPIYDFCAVVLSRLVLKRNIMSADRSHLHHYFLSFGLSHFQTTMIILFAAITLLCLGVLLENNYPSLSLIVFIGLFIVYLSLRVAIRKNS
ncbi:undecaprenyl/decaprenyl-phosphate alpha-N-acetylglucosaminyl 1-phosphate transferase [Alphaproteobacteria bacterium]|nr:undecaprenyl/decaprenyl-phosphate alpha-N-acetylglucosaminyl 1-phosphate transferase [Alphaproteobacteria bacterium]